MRHFNIVIKGKVQGVFFRVSAKEKASRIGVTGFVYNVPDGSIYMEIEGTATMLIEMVDWCRLGPTGATVTDVNVSEGDLKNFSKFEITRRAHPF